MISGPPHIFFSGTSDQLNCVRAGKFELAESVDLVPAQLELVSLFHRFQALHFLCVLASLQMKLDY